MKVVINDKERGLLYRKGKLKKLLDAGNYTAFGSEKIEKSSILQAFVPLWCTIDSLMLVKGAGEKLIQVDVADNEMCLHYLDGNFKDILSAGRYAFWKEGGKHEFRMINIEDPEIGDKLKPYEIAKLSSAKYQTVNVKSGEKARLYYDNRLVRILEPGTYYFWKNGVNVEAQTEDMRIRRLTIDGQEILTSDKVGLRINFVMNFKVTDPAKVAEIADHNIYMYLYSLSQLVLREYVGRHSTDEILASRDSIADEVLNVIRERSENAYVIIESAGIKDIILPGEISAIMNSVLAAEKRAQANVITRREEVASTRSLLNTAKLMDENETLRRLKELEYLERICEHVGEINVNGGSGLLDRLAEIAGRK